MVEPNSSDDYELAFMASRQARLRDAELWRGAVSEGSAEYPSGSLDVNAKAPGTRDYLAADVNNLSHMRDTDDGRFSQDELDAALWRLGQQEAIDRVA